MKSFSRFLVAVGTLSFILVSVFSIIFWYGFVKNCEDYLKLAGDAPNVVRADEFLGQALGYIEKENLTSGNSSYIFNRPNNNVGIWYEQIKGAKETTSALLKKSKENLGSVSQLEQDNALMKIREVVLDTSSSGTRVTLPDAITWFPYQWGMMIWWWISTISFIGGWVMIIKERVQNNGYHYQ